MKTFEPGKNERDLQKFGEALQCILATELRGWDNIHALAKAVRDLDGIDVDSKCIELGFGSFAELLHSPKMAKFVVAIKQQGTASVVYRAKMDGTTRQVMELQREFEMHKQRRDQRRHKSAQQVNQKWVCAPPATALPSPLINKKSRENVCQKPVLNTGRQNTNGKGEVDKRQKWQIATEGPSGTTQIGRKSKALTNSPPTNNQCWMDLLSEDESSAPSIATQKISTEEAKGGRKGAYQWDEGSSSDDSYFLNIAYSSSSTSHPRPNPVTPSHHQPPPPISMRSPTSPIKAVHAQISRESTDTNEYISGWKLMPNPDDPNQQHNAYRTDGVCKQYPQYNVTKVEDPRRGVSATSLATDLALPMFKTLGSKTGKQKGTRLSPNRAKLITIAPKEEEGPKKVVVEEAELITIGGGSCTSSDSFETACGENIGFLSEEKMRHLGTIAMEMCRYQYRFGKPALVKFNDLFSLLCRIEPDFKGLAMADVNRLTDFFRRFCPRLDFLYAPPTFTLDQFLLCWCNIGEDDKNEKRINLERDKDNTLTD